MYMNWKIGVIVAIYNVEKYLIECIESIINQTYHNLEIILVDDGSTDSSGKICDEYETRDSRIRVIHQNNCGLIMTRYNGLQETKCEYVTFVDGDDWLDLNAYNRVADYLDGGTEIIAFGSKMYYNPNNVAAELTYFPAGNYSKQEINDVVIPNMIWNIREKNYGLYPAIWSKVAKRSLVLKSLEHAKTLDIYYGEDAAIVYPMIKEAESLVIIEDSLYYHRQREAGVLPQYISDERFMSKLFAFYSFLMEQFSDYKECQRRIDYLYIHAINLRKRIYGDYSYNDRYMFPFARVPKNSNIVLYGAGSVGQTYYDQLRRARYCNVIAWVDKNYSKYRTNGGLNVDSVETMDKLDFDYVVIAVLSLQFTKMIKRELLDKGIDEEKIVWGNCIEPENESNM